MSIRFRRPAPPQPPADEQTYWRLGKRDRLGKHRTAEARVRRLPGVGLELRVLVGTELAYSQV
jgi:hypothetical protein